MNQLFRVRFEIRKPGAIGVFDWSPWTEIYAGDDKAARAKEFDRLHAEGFETRSPDVEIFRNDKWERLAVAERTV